MIAFVRPDSWNVPLFLHIFGAIALFGAMGTALTLAWAGRRAGSPSVLAHGAFGTLLLVALPAWLLMFVFGSVTESREHLPDGVNWVEVPSMIASVGLLVLLAATGAAFSWRRSPAGIWQPRALAVLSAAYIATLALAWWVMTTKPDL
jgi:hypothetical protein